VEYMLLTPRDMRPIPQVVAARGDRFAYASTLAIYIFNRDDQALSKVGAASLLDQNPPRPRPSLPPLPPQALAPEPPRAPRAPLIVSRPPSPSRRAAGLSCPPPSTSTTRGSKLHSYWAGGPGRSTAGAGVNGARDPAGGGWGDNVVESRPRRLSPRIRSSGRRWGEREGDRRGHRVPPPPL